MRILILGGTAFVGRAIVEDALRSGAEVTLFGRGRTGSGLFPGVPRLTGDRDTSDAFHAVGPAEPVTLGGLIETCARAAGAQVEMVPVPAETAPPLFPLVRAHWPGQQRSPAKARAAGLHSAAGAGGAGRSSRMMTLIPSAPAGTSVTRAGSW